jgi:hypothetical protein
MDPTNPLPPSGDQWMRHMRRGDWEAAWQISDNMLRARAGKPCWHLPRHLQYVWDGRQLAGQRVLVRCYHGLGDTVQFARFAPLLAQTAAKVIFWAQPRLLPLLQTVRGIDCVLPLHDGTPDVEYDVDVEIMELPHALRVTPATLPSTVPYIHVEPCPRKSPERMTAGIVWASGDWDECRSVPLTLMQELIRLPEISWQIFQRGPALAQWQRDADRPPAELPQVDTILDEACAMRTLDLMICVDTLSAHLAGALGVPTWTLLHAQPDWRWMDTQEETPWYPTMRLFRQEQSDDWVPVIARVAAQLRCAVAARA